jgi:TolB-like protein
MKAERLPLGGFTLDLARGELLGAGEHPAPLRRQALQMLLVLGARAGEVVSKDELMDRVWGDVVVGEGSLTQAVADIRRALGDTRHRMLRNVARRGYMLVPDAAKGLDADTPALAIVVLPLVLQRTTTDEDDDTWLADALHGDLTAEMARIQGSWVIARSTAATYRHRDVDPRQVARELHVRYVVQGSMRREGPRLRVDLALVQGEDGMQRWAETFVFDRAQLAQTLADVAVRLTRALAPALFIATAERRAALSALEVSADDLAMRATALWYRGFNAANIVEALKLLERAVALDGECTRAWAALPPTLWQCLANGWLPDRDAVQRRIEEASAQLMRHDADGLQSYAARGILAFMREDWASMLRLTAAFTERHRHSNAFGARGMALLVTGASDDAVAALETAMRLSPRDPIIAEFQYRLAMAHFVATRYEAACDWGQTAALHNPSLPWPPVHAAALHRLGHEAEARAAYLEHAARHPDFDATRLLQRLPGSNPAFAEARERLVHSLRALGMR